MKKGFTLIELLIVIGILAILTAAVVIVLNPAELLKQARDSQRMTDLDAMKNALVLFIADGKDFATAYGGGSALNNTTCYASQIGATTCATRASSARTTIASSTSRVVTGTGWIPLDLTAVTSGAPLQTLPVDPTNIASSELYYSALFNTASSTFELNATFESTKYLGRMANAVDGGNSASLYEEGTAPGLAL